MSIETFIKDQIRNRETRLRSPGFQAEMAREKAEFKGGLSNIGNSALDFVYTGIGKKILGGSINSAAKFSFLTLKIIEVSNVYTRGKTRTVLQSLRHSQQTDRALFSIFGSVFFASNMKK